MDRFTKENTTTHGAMFGDGQWTIVICDKGNVIGKLQGNAGDSAVDEFLKAVSYAYDLGKVGA